METTNISEWQNLLLTLTAQCYYLEDLQSVISDLERRKHKMINLNECILYRNFEHGELLDQMVSIIHAYESKELSDAALLEEKRTLYYNCMNQLVEMAGAYGFLIICGMIILHFYLSIMKMLLVLQAKFVVRWMEPSMNWQNMILKFLNSSMTLI